MTIHLVEGSGEKATDTVFLTTGDGEVLTDQSISPTSEQLEQYAAAIAHVNTPACLVQRGGKIGVLYVREFPNLAEDAERDSWTAPWQTQRAVRDAMAKLAAILEKKLFENVYLGYGTGVLGRDEVMVFEPFFPVDCGPSEGGGKRWMEAMAEFEATLVKPNTSFRPATAYRISLEDLQRDLLHYLQNAYGQVIESVRVWWDEESELVRVSVEADPTDADVIAGKLAPLLEVDIEDETLYGLVGDMLGVTIVEDRSTSEELFFLCTD